MTELIERQLEQLEAQAAVLVSAIRNFRLGLASTVHEQPSEHEQECPHKAREAAPVMGMPNRFFCRDCMTMVGGK